MRLDLTFTEHFTAPVQNVWLAITDRRLLALWLMENDFEPRLGARFRLQRADPMVGWRGWVECEVIELTPPTRMVWSWSDGAGEEMTSRVIFELQEDGTGTRLTLRHFGETDDAMEKMIRERWPDQTAGSGLHARRRTVMTRTLKQTVLFKDASPRKVYDLLMSSRKHTSLSREKAVLSRRVGGAFSAWNRHITGFNLALRPGRKIVQAWRATGWWPDHYSVATFDFQKMPHGTKLTFTQTGIPPHRYSGHYRGWIETYWTPMQEMLRDGHLSQKTLARVKVDREQRIKAGRFRRTLSTKS